MKNKMGYTESEDEAGGVKAKSRWFFNHIVFTIIVCFTNIFYTGHLAYLGAAISMIERRFQMKSTQSGLFFTINDVVGLCSVLFITHFGQKGNRPRIIGCLYLIFGVGVLISTLPHFLYKLPLSLRLGVTTGLDEHVRGDHEDYVMCNEARTGRNNATCDAEHSSQSGALYHEAWWLYLGQALSGLISANGPLIITFLDDNQNRKNTPLFVGIIFSSFTIGIVAGFFLANFCLILPVSFPNIDPVDTVLDPRDPRFLGAWWLGLVICGVGVILCSLPIFFFPRHLPGKRRPPLDETKEEETFIASKMPGFGAFGDLVQALKRILTNVAVMALVLATCCSINSFVGLRAFGTKYINTQFDIPLSQASLLTGVIIIPCAIFGNITGGMIIKKLRLQTRGMAMMAITLLLIVLTFNPLYFLAGCEQNPKAGLTVPYGPYNDTRFTTNLPDLSSACNNACNCPPIYRPVCGSDGVTYSSPCHAGCSEETVYVPTDSSIGYNQTVFLGCSCLSTTDDTMNPPEAIPGECGRDCSFLFHVLIGFILATVGSLSTTPGVMLQIRCVEERDRSLVLGFVNVMMKLLAYIPGPVIWGAIVDRTCVMFQESCGKTGNCVVYDTDKFRHVYYATVMMLKFVEMIFLCVGLSAIIHGLRKAKGTYCLWYISKVFLNVLRLPTSNYPSYQPSEEAGLTLQKYNALSVLKPPDENKMEDASMHAPV